MITKKISKKVLAGLLALSLVVPFIPAVDTEKTTAQAATKEVVLEKSPGNPIAGFDAAGKRVYGGDPSVLVDGDTVYLYVGHDVSTGSAYDMPEWLCYSSKDMKTWKYESVIMKADNKSSIKWASTSNSAWAGQVMKYKNKYYFYYCTWAKTEVDNDKQCIGVAVSDSPTGPFKDKGSPLVKGSVTEPQSSNWNDIDPTAWIEKDAKGVEHRYLAWGNNKYYICELNEDMVSVKDQNKDGKITCGTSTASADILDKTEGLPSFTEAPWLYRRQDAKGNYYGKYYMFYAYGWREQMAYATTDDLMNGKWDFGSVIMTPTATSNTNHMAVFDFKGKTYFVYHNGSLPGRSGFRRVACVTELHFNADGSVKPMEETATGLTGKTTTIYTNSGQPLSHKKFTNSSSDIAYPYAKVKVGAGLSSAAADRKWVLTAGKADPSKGSYVSIQSENKPGLYLTVNSARSVTLAQDADAAAMTAKKQTFRSVQGLSDSKGVSFESVYKPGYYLTIVNGTLTVTKGSDKVAATFYTSLDASDKSLRSIGVTMSKNEFFAGSKVTAKRATVRAFYANGITKKVTKFTSNAAKIKTKKTGTKTLKITYKEGGISKTTTVPVVIRKRPAKVKKLKAASRAKKSVGLKWKKSAGASGYEISYGKKKKKRSYYQTVKSTKCKVRDLKRRTAYYFHVRSYTTLNGKKSYSKYTTVRAKTK